MAIVRATLLEVNPGEITDDALKAIGAVFRVAFHRMFARRFTGPQRSGHDLLLSSHCAANGVSRPVAIAHHV
jgi:hypothetical protein